MNILALEFSSPHRAVAVLEAAGADCRLLAEIQDPDFRGTTAMMLVDRALQAAALSPDAVDLIALGLGPGSYTGIRSSIAIAQGWQLARGTPAAAVSTAELLANQAVRARLGPRLQLLIDAQRGEYYSATYDLTSGAPKLQDPLRILPPEAISPEPGTTLAGPEPLARFPALRELLPSAALLGELASRQSSRVPAERLEPIYLRAPNFVKAPPPRIL